MPNVHSLWERSSNRSKRTSASFLVVSYGVCPCLRTGQARHFSLDQHDTCFALRKSHCLCLSWKAQIRDRADSRNIRLGPEGGTAISLRTLLKVLPTEWRSCCSQRRTRGREGGASCRSQDHRFFHPGENRVSKGIAVLPGLVPGKRTRAWSRLWVFLNQNSQS